MLRKNCINVEKFSSKLNINGFKILTYAIY